MKIIVLFFAFILLSPDIMASHQEVHGDGHINWFKWDTESPPLGWYIINFVILFGLLGYILKKRINEFFKNRYDNMKRQMDESIKIRDEALAKLREIEEKLQKIDYYRSAIKEEYIDMARKEKEEILNHAKRNAQSLISSAKQTILFETLEIRKEIIKQILKDATEKSLILVKSQYSMERDRQVIEEFVDSLKSVDKKHFGYIV